MVEVAVIVEAVLVVTATMACTRDVAEEAVETTATAEEDRIEDSNDVTHPDQGADLGLTDATTGMEDREAITESRENGGRTTVLLPGQDHRPDAGAREGTNECDDDWYYAKSYALSGMNDDIRYGKNNW
jgi:hypothetical protein